MEQVVSVESVENGVDPVEVKEVDAVLEKEEVQGDFVPDTQPVVSAQETYIKTGLSPEELRKRIPQLYVQIQEHYLVLAQCLLEVKHSKKILDEWGYGTFKEYAQKELGVYYSKANYLSRIWLHFGKEQELLVKMKALGWDKMKELLHVINGENADYWLSKAKMMTADDLRKDVKVYLRSLVPGDDAKTAVAAEAQVQNTPLADELHTMAFHFVYENYLTVNTAIERLQKENPGITPPEALALICGEYLGTQGDGSGLDQAVGTIKKLEVFQPLQCVVVSRENQEVLHGKELFQSLVGQAFKGLNA